MEIALQAEKIFIANKPIDFRRAIDGLCAAVVEDMDKNPSEGIYIFYNRGLDRVKILGWHKNGFVMLYKRLEKGKFILHAQENGNLQINSKQLSWLLTGVDWRLLSEGECKIDAYF